MHGINPGVQLPFHLQPYREKVLLVSSLATFILFATFVATMAATNTQIGIVSYAFSGTFCIGSLIAFATGTILLNRKYRQQLEANLEKVGVKQALRDVDLPIAQISPVWAEVPVHQELKKHIIALTNAGEQLLIAFAQAYYRSTGTTGAYNLKKKTQPLKDAVGILKNLFIKLLNDEVQWLRFCMMSAEKLLDKKRLASSLKTSTDEAFIKSLPGLIKTENEDDDHDDDHLEEVMNLGIELIKEAFKRIAENPPTHDKQIREIIANLRDIAQKIEQAEASYNFAVMEKLNSDFDKNLILLIDRLFLKCPIDRGYILGQVEQLLKPFFVPDDEQILSDGEESEDSKLSKYELTQKIFTFLFEEAFPEIFEALPAAFEDDDIFANEDVRKAVYFGTSIAGRKALSFALPKFLNMVPALDRIDPRDPRDYKEKLIAGINAILPEIVNPLYYGFFDKKHPFRKGMIAFVKKLKPPKIEKPDGSDPLTVWAYLNAITEYIKNVTEMLEAHPF
jgi:hypothetical protein